jgi:hypothetical protein
MSEGAIEVPSGRARIMAGQDLMEYICQEDNFDLQHISGPAKGPDGAQ